MSRIDNNDDLEAVGQDTTVPQDAVRSEDTTPMSMDRASMTVPATRTSSSHGDATAAGTSTPIPRKSKEDEVSPSPPGERDPAYKVTFENAPASSPGVRDPRTWSLWYKIFLTTLLSLMAFVPSLGSSIASSAQDAIAAEYGASQQVVVLATSLYVLGFAFGPVFWAPISELFGRRYSLIPGTFVLGLFEIGNATSRSLASIFVTRFFAGVFGAAAVANVTASLGDFCTPRQRGIAMACYSCCVVGGPLLGPTISAALTQRYSWRWTGYVEAILAFGISVVVALFLPELYPPVLLKKEAARRRKTTGDSRWYHPHEEVRLDPRSIVTKHLARPLLMLTTEPMCTAVCLYASLAYTLVYMTLQLVGLVFTENYGYSPVVSTLPFLAIFTGIIVIGLPVTLLSQPYYRRKVDAAGGGRAVPEARLPPVAIGGVFLTVGLFEFAWTSQAKGTSVNMPTPPVPPEPKYHWVVPCVGLALVGAGFNTVFQNCLNFLIDSYGLYGASASSANTILRSFLAAGLPFAVRPMVKNLGSPVAVSILGAILGAFIPVPWLLMRYTPALRARSRFAMKQQEQQQQQQQKQ